MRKPLLHSVLSSAVASALSVAAAGAAATQHLAIRDGDTQFARISATESTRIKVEQGRIDDLIGDIRNADKNKLGRLIVETTDDPTEIYVHVAPDVGLAEACRSLGVAAAALSGAARCRPISLFLKVSKKTYGLVLQPVDMPPDQIFVREQDTDGAPSAVPGSMLFGQAGSGAAPAAGAASQAGPTPRFPTAPVANLAQPVVQGSFPTNATYYRAVKALWYAMATNIVPSDIEVRDVGAEVGLWREARLVQQRLYIAQNLVGEAYELRNVSAAPMVLAEPELDRPDVLFVSIAQHQLGPGEATPVWIIRNRGERD